MTEKSHGIEAVEIQSMDATNGGLKTAVPRLFCYLCPRPVILAIKGEREQTFLATQTLHKWHEDVESTRNVVMLALSHLSASGLFGTWSFSVI